MLALWDFNTFTGFATVSKNLVANFQKEFGADMQLDICAVNYFGDDYNHSDNVRVISAKMKDVAKDDFGRYVFMRSLKDIDYDLIFILQDLGVIVPCIPLFEKIKKEKERNGRTVFKSIYYFPVDFALTPNLTKDLEFFDYLATYTEFGKSQVLRLKPRLEPKLHVIPHGNNPEEFNVLDEKTAMDFRRKYFGKNADKFIITNINRNQSRKDIPNTIFGFLEYHTEFNQDSFLYLHMNPKDPMGWNLRTILNQTPLKEGIDYQFPKEEDINKGASVETMNLIYNASDVFLTTATGGGWELSFSEAMATKLPCIVPNHTSLSELAKNGERAYMLETLYPTVAMVDNIIRFQADLYEIADVIDNVKRDIDNNSKDLATKLNKAYEYVHSLDWVLISKHFIKTIKTLLK